MFSQLSPALKFVLLGVIVALAIATDLVMAMIRRQPERSLRELWLRVRTWWISVGLFILAVLLNRPGVLVFFALVSTLALREYLTLVPARAADWRVLSIAYASIPFQYLWIYLEWYGMFIIFIPVYLFLLIPTRLVTIGVTDGFLQSTSALHWGLMTTVFSISHAAYLLVLSPGANSRWPIHLPSPSDDDVATGAGLLLFLVMFTELNDIFQYLWGKSFGSRRVAPHISPKKTWAGMLGGVATTTVLAAIVGPWLTFMDWQHAILAGALIGVAGFAGDL